MTAIIGMCWFDCSCELHSELLIIGEARELANGVKTPSLQELTTASCGKKKFPKKTKNAAKTKAKRRGNKGFLTGKSIAS